MQAPTYPSAVIDALGERIDRRPERSSIGAPSRNELAALLDAAFFASTHEEEARRVVFDCAFVAPHEAREAGVAALEFATPVSLEPRRIAKLALATRLEVNAIAVHRVDGALVLWGIVMVDPALRDAVVVRVRGPAVLMVERDGETLLRYARGVATVRDTPGCAAIASHLRPAIARLDALGQLAQSIAERGHGGALFVLEDPERDLAASVDDPSAHPFDELRYRVRGPAVDQLARAQEPRAVARACDAIASLAGVDGAVLLSRSLTVLAFGAFVRSPSEDTRIQLVDCERRPQPMSQLKGARHKSALWFCQRSPGALAIVLSQDGDLSVYWRLADAVMVERDLASGALRTR